MNQINTGITEIFDAEADRYDDSLHIIQYFPLKWIAEHAHDLGSTAKCRILDLGCGTGLNVRLLREHCAGIQADGVDISSGMLKHARISGLYERLYSHDLNYPLPDIPSDTYDIAVAFGFFEHLSQVSVCLSECRRALKINGKLWASFQRFEADDPASPPRRTFIGKVGFTGYSAAEILRMMSILDMRVIALDPLAGYVTGTGFPCPYYILQAQRLTTQTEGGTHSAKQDDLTPRTRL